MAIGNDTLFIVDIFWRAFLAVSIIYFFVFYAQKQSKTFKNKTQYIGGRIVHAEDIQSDVLLDCADSPFFTIPQNVKTTKL